MSEVGAGRAGEAATPFLLAAPPPAPNPARALVIRAPALGAGGDLPAPGPGLTPGRPAELSKTAAGED